MEMLFEPLLHIVRNAIHHGIESPGERAARGKPSTARIHIRAARQGDQVLLESATTAVASMARVSARWR